MNIPNVSTSVSRDQQEKRLFLLAGLFLLIYALILSLASSVRLHLFPPVWRWEHWSGLIVWAIGFFLLRRAASKRIPDRDPFLLPIMALLSGLGVLTVWRIAPEFGLRQTIWLGVSLAAMWVIFRIPHILVFIRRYKYIWLFCGLFLTALTFFVGIYPSGEGPQLWLKFFGIYIQPSEPLKLLLIVYLAAYFADLSGLRISLMEQLGPTLILVLTAILLLVGQRDLGTALLLVVLYIAFLYLASGKRRILLMGGLLAILAGLGGYLLFDVIRLRVDAWLNPWMDPGGRSYQVIQSIIAVAEGGLFGTGPGLGSPGLVPVAQSDFIAASIAEETGLLGMLGLLALYLMLVERGILTALHAPNPFQRLLASGITLYLGAQAALILGGNLRLLPLTGVTLPFVSYGGSSILTAFIATALLLICSNSSEQEPVPLTNPNPYLFVTGILGTIFIMLMLITGWWSVIRSDILQNRDDNQRRVISDRFVFRGSLLDRNNEPLAITEGEAGSYTRKLLYPPLSATIGYNTGGYGQGGLEASLDDYLRGLKGASSIDVFFSDLLYNQPPTGLDVRLSLDQKTQQVADTWLGKTTGALVLLNAETGEVLAMSTSPTFDANQIETRAEEWKATEGAPLLNRAIQGTYPPGTAIEAFLYAKTLTQSSQDVLPSTDPVDINGRTFACLRAPENSLESQISAGCPDAGLVLSQQFTAGQLSELFRALGFYSTPEMLLPSAPAPRALTILNPSLAAVGQDGMQITPLQMALAACTLSSGGNLPVPRLAIAVHTVEQDWMILPNKTSSPALPAFAANEAAQNLAANDLPAWEVLGSAAGDSNRFTWYLAGTLPDWQGSPLALALVIESDDAALAKQIGSAVLKKAIEP